MTYYLIICRSLTYAQRSAKALERAGITAVVLRTPRELTDNGCGYCLKVSEKHLRHALSVLRDAGLEAKKVYIKRADGYSAEVHI